MKYSFRTVCALLLSVVLITSCARNGSESNDGKGKPKKTKVVLIWCDVTSSLKELEIQSVSKVASTLLDQFPSDTKYLLYPIQTETGRPLAIIKSLPSIGDNTETDVSDESMRSNGERAQVIAKEIKRLYDENNDKNPNDRRTCILNTLDVSAKFFSQFGDRYDPELIFVSDMIEDCENTPLNKEVHLDKQPFSETIKLVDSFTTAPDLSKLRITIVVPTAKDTSTVPVGHRPSTRDLEQFWKTVFAKCKFNAADFSNPERFYWSPEGLPERFNRQKPLS